VVVVVNIDHIVVCGMNSSESIDSEESDELERSEELDEYEDSDKLIGFLVDLVVVVVAMEDGRLVVCQSSSFESDVYDEPD
jgi:hypothetical protein